jgi:hypothetical protein
MKELINDTQRQIMASFNIFDLEKTGTATTVVNQQFYNTGVDFDRMISVILAVGTTTYSLVEVSSQLEWDMLNEASFTSDVPQFYFILADQVGIYPTPSSSSNTITFTFKKRIKDMTEDDFTTGTVASITNGATTMVGNAPSWVTAQAGRFIRITSDGDWYEIASVTNSTTLELTKNYEGTTLAAATEAYIIGDMPVIPENHHQMLAWRPVANYFRQNGDLQRASVFEQMYQDGLVQMRRDHGNKTTDPNVDGTAGSFMRNPNLFLTQ